MPRAVMSDAFGPPNIYQLRNLPRLLLKPDEVRIAIHAAGISFVDVLTARGEYQVRPPLPFIPGSEGAGVVEEVGNDVRSFGPGDRVVVSSWGGIFADEVILPEHLVQEVPPGMSLEEAAVFPVSYATAWHALIDRAQLKTGETALVLGAAGATGYAAVQIAKHLGARVIASAGSDEGQMLAARGGADATVDARTDDWRGAVRAAAEERPIDVVFDPVGGSATESAFRSLGWKGRHLVIGFPAGIATLRTNLPLLKGASLVGVDVRQFDTYEVEKSAGNRAAIFALAAAGVLKPAIARTFPLKEYAAAMDAAVSRKAIGRILLTMVSTPEQERTRAI